MKRLVLLFLILVTSSLGGLGCTHSQARSTSAASIAANAVGAHRSAAHIARNPERHPLETLTFFGVEEDMTVIEVLPGGLWYSEILGPLLRDRGDYIVASYDMSVPDQPEYRTRGHQNMVARFEREPEIFGDVQIVTLSPPESIDLGPPGSADRVLTFRATHGWIRDGVADEVYAAFFEVLKPGGILGVVQHRAGEATPKDPAVFTGYVDEDQLIEIAENAGFVLDGRSEINANPRDTADYPGGVWTLPPSLRLGDVDRERYLAIGESDRMTLRFRKP